MKQWDRILAPNTRWWQVTPRCRQLC